MLLVCLGEAEAASVLKHLDPKVVQRVGAEMTRLQGISREEMSNVITRFLSDVSDQASVDVGSEDSVRRILVNALGDDKANGIIDRIALGRTSKGLDALKWMEPRAVAEMIRLEHPQIIAIIMAYLDTEQAAEVLRQFPQIVQADIVMRVATLDGIQPAALARLDEMMEKQFSGSAGGRSSNLGGAKSAANMVNLIEGSGNSDVMEQIRKVDENLAQRIQDLMFVFDNLNEGDDRGIQELLRRIDGSTLVRALKGADESIREKMFKNMSERSAEAVREEMEITGPVRVADVEVAQKEIVAEARRMVNAGELVLAGRGEAYI